MTSPNSRSLPTVLRGFHMSPLRFLLTFRLVLWHSWTSILATAVVLLVTIRRRCLNRLKLRLSASVGSGHWLVPAMVWTGSPGATFCSAALLGGHTRSVRIQSSTVVSRRWRPRDSPGEGSRGGGGGGWYCPCGIAAEGAVVAAVVWRLRRAFLGVWVVVERTSRDRHGLGWWPGATSRITALLADLAVVEGQCWVNSGCVHRVGAASRVAALWASSSSMIGMRVVCRRMCVLSFLRMVWCGATSPGNAALLACPCRRIGHIVRGVWDGIRRRAGAERYAAVPPGVSSWSSGRCGLLVWVGPGVVFVGCSGFRHGRPCGGVWVPCTSGICAVPGKRVVGRATHRSS